MARFQRFLQDFKKCSAILRGSSGMASSQGKVQGQDAPPQEDKTPIQKLRRQAATEEYRLPPRRSLATAPEGGLAGFGQVNTPEGPAARGLVINPMGCDSDLAIRTPPRPASSPAEELVRKFADTLDSIRMSLGGSPLPSRRESSRWPVRRPLRHHKIH